MLENSAVKISNEYFSKKIKKHHFYIYRVGSVHNEVYFLKEKFITIFIQEININKLLFKQIVKKLSFVIFINNIKVQCFLYNFKSQNFFLGSIVYEIKMAEKSVEII